MADIAGRGGGADVTDDVSAGVQRLATVALNTEMAEVHTRGMRIVFVYVLKRVVITKFTLNFVQPLFGFPR
jgi:hypothetical protein